MATDALPTNHSQQGRSPYRSNGTWQVAIAVVGASAFLVVLASGLTVLLSCGWTKDFTDEQCDQWPLAAAITLVVLGSTTLGLFIRGAVRRSRSQPRPGPVAMALAFAAAALGVIALIVGVLTAVVAVAAANFVGLVLGTAAIATGVASLMNLPTDQSRGQQRAMAMGGAIAAVVAFLISTYGGT